MQNAAAVGAALFAFSGLSELTRKLRIETDAVEEWMGFPDSLSF